YNHRYIRFNISQTKSYIIKDKQNNGISSDPDFSLYKIAPFENIGTSDNQANGIETATYRLKSGNYLLDISDYNDLERACFDIILN
ncbi:MAG: hypothetical protein KAU90_06640, partial [Sulfurovaceae bacterium]|nr:hypothetical protein [Sulfurovaceae bacterium]